MKIFTLIISMIFISNLAQGDFSECGQPVIYDKYNYITFNDIGRRSSDKGVFFGNEIMLEVYRPDGNYTQKIWDVSDHGVPISSQIYQMTYRDVDHFWIISRLGKQLDGAILYDLKERKIAAGIYGKNLALSPDKKHIAYTFPSGSGEYVVFVDHTLVSPVFKDGFVDHDIEGPKNSEGKRYSDFLNDHKGLSLEGRPKWEDNDRLLIVTRKPKAETDEATIIKGFSAIPHIDDSGSTRSIKLTTENQKDYHKRGDASYKGDKP